MDKPTATDWYDQLRLEYKPKQLRILLIGESVPDPGDGERRFFYSPVLSKHDNLYRGVMKVICDSNASVADKAARLGEFCQSGYWLIDAVDVPVNRKTMADRRRAIAAHIPSLVKRCLALAPSEGVVICHGMVYEFAAEALRSAGVRILHTKPIPFPLGNWREAFAVGLRACLQRVRHDIKE